MTSLDAGCLGRWVVSQGSCSAMAARARAAAVRCDPVHALPSPPPSRPRQVWLCARRGGRARAGIYPPLCRASPLMATVWFSAHVAAPMALWLWALRAAVVGGARAPDPSAIGADLLCRAASTCDMPTAWRLLNSSAFQTASLTRRGSKGETPLAAAVCSGCPELVALLMLHPDFDDSTVRKMRHRKAFTDHVARNRRGAGKQVDWALRVVDGVRASKVSQTELERDSSLVHARQVWFLPQLGEWMRPMSLEEMGVDVSGMPDWNILGVADTTSREHGVMYSFSGANARISDFERLWHLLVAYARAEGEAETRASIVRHVRSIGWSLFFSGGMRALTGQMLFIAKVLESQVDLPADHPVSRYMQAEGLDVSMDYQLMSNALGEMWNKTGDWVLP